MEQQSTEVSVITACYNSEQFIASTMDSVLTQTFSNWEMIIIDDNSTDNSVSIIKDYQQKDKRIKLIELDHNSGAAVARNTGILEATGKFIAFLDSDDLWYPNKLERQIVFMSSANSPLTFTSYEVISESGEALNEIINARESLKYRDMLSSNKIGCLTAIYDQEKLGKVYMPLLKKRQDYGLWLKILRSGVEAKGLQEVLSKYRKRQGSISNNKLELLRWNWKLYREEEKLSFIASIYYVFLNVVYKLAKN